MSLNELDTWSLWCTETATNSTTWDLPWNAWNATVEATAVQVRQHVEREVARQVELAAYQERERVRRLEYEATVQKQRAEALVAEARAEELLKSMLTDEQREQWTKGYIYLKVEGGEKDGKALEPRHYQINKGTHGNIRRLSGPAGTPGTMELESWCIQPSGVPVPDANLAQLLHLRYNEEGLRRVANVTRRW